MKRLNKTLCAGMLCAIAGLSAMPTTAQAEGFALFEWSARGVALGGAVVARADDPSAIAYNPAGITQLPGAQVQLGFSTMIPSIDIVRDGQNTTSNESSVFFVPSGYYTQQLNDKWWLGLGMYSRFGLGLGYGDDWSGRLSMIEANLETFSVSPVLAYKVNDKLSVSAGIEIMKADLNLTQGIISALTPTDTTSKLYAEADCLGLGALAAIHYKPAEDWSIGLSYKSQIKLSFDGYANVGGGTSAALVSLLSGSAISSATGEVVLPEEILFGIAHQLTDDLSIEVGAVWSHWSNYKQLSLHMDGFAEATGLKNPISPKNWKNTMRYNVGVEYAALDWLDLRFGYAYDESPVSSAYADYMVPTNDRHLLSTGAGFYMDNWTFDVAYCCIFAADRSFDGSSAHGVVSGQSDNGITHVASFAVGYKF